MKPRSPPGSTEITPSKKKLKQARLPFQVLSDVSPKPSTPPTRKRKLSAPESDNASKIGKISKENDDISEPVVISDDESQDVKKPKREDKLPNPYVKLVDAAWKKKQKSKKKLASKKKIKKITNGSIEKSDQDNANVEKMEIDGEDNLCDQSEQNSDNDKEITSRSENYEQLSENNKKSIILQSTVIEDSSDTTSETSKNTIKSKQNIEESDIKTIIPEEVVEKVKHNLDECDIENSTSEKENSDSDSENSSKDIKDDKPEYTSESENIKENTTQVTPKRSTRLKVKPEETTSPSLNGSTASTNVTPRSRKSVSNAGDDSMNGSINLTPKQLLKKQESAKKKEEREKERIEREKKRQQEKDERAKQRQEKEEQRKKEREEKEEAKKKEKQEKEDLKRKEREEKEKQKELEKKMKEEKEELKRKEREEKEEQRRKEKEAREEERKKKQEALDLEKQEQELKKKKAAEAFVNFFVPKQKSEKDQPTLGPVSKNGILSSFTIKADMRIAPLTRVDFDEDKRQDFDNIFNGLQLSEDDLYLKSLKRGDAKPRCNGKTWPLTDKDDDDECMIIEDELPPITDGSAEIITCDSAPREKLRPKLFSFHENRRPPYWGTWRKKSVVVKPRRPFGQDSKHLDYEVDSDEEWEEEQEGESLDGSVAGSDEEPDENEYEVDNDMFVPHGYLSDEEATMDEDDVLSLSPEAQKQRLKHLEDEFETELKKPTEKLKPRLYGLLWTNNNNEKPEKCVDTLWNYFGKLAMIMSDPIPYLQPSTVPDEEKKKIKKRKVVAESEEKSPKVEKKKKPKEPKESKKAKSESKKVDVNKNQPGINSFLAKLKSADT